MKTLLTIALTAILSMNATAAFAACGPKMSGKTLAVRWPELLGESVTVQAQMVRALSPMKYLIKVDGVDATVMTSKGWQGKRSVCVTVMGSETIADKGRTQVISLLMSNDAE